VADAGRRSGSDERDEVPGALRTGLACEMRCARSTCHMTVEVGGDSQRSIDGAEGHLLDFRRSLNPPRRLLSEAIRSSQAFKIETPKYTVNHARAKH
jgi:ferredoxin